MLNDATPPVSHALHRAAVFTIWPEMPATADPARHRIWAYCDALSYAPGDLVRVHVQCSAASFDLEITRDSASPQIVLAKEGLRGGRATRRRIARSKAAAGRWRSNSVCRKIGAPPPIA